MRKIIILLLWQITFFTVIKANNISLYSGDVQFEVPDDYVEKTIPQRNDIGYYSESNNKAIVLCGYRSPNFDESKVMDGMDSCICDLSKYKLVDSEREAFWNVTKDYITRKYVAEDGHKFASHTTYVKQGAYCFGFWYNTDEEYKDFENLIKSIHFSEEEGWGQVGLVMEYSIWFPLLLVILLFVVSILAGASGEQDFGTSIIVSFFITLGIALIILLPLWHFWVAYLAILGFYFVICFFCAFWGFYLVPGGD